MALSAPFSQSSFSFFSSFTQSSRKNPLRFSSIRPIKAAAEADKEKTKQTKTQDSNSASATNSVQPATAAPKRPNKPVYSSEFLEFSGKILIKFKETKTGAF